MKLSDLREAIDDDLDDSDEMSRSKDWQSQIKAVLVKLGFDKHDIVEVDVDDGEVEITLDTGINGINLKLLEKLHNTDMGKEYFVASLDSANIAIKFKLNKMS